MPPGLWNPALPNILETYNALWVIPYATAVGPLVAIFSSLMFTSLADRRIEAQKLLGILTLSGSLFLWLSFSVLSWGWNPWWYVFMQGCNALISAPMWALLTKIALVNTSDPQKKFPLYRVWGTVGWLFAGVLVSWLHLDASAEAGKIGAFVRLGLGGLCFMLPRTPARGEKASNWKQALGLSAFSLFSNRSLRVYFITATLFAIPLAAHYMYAPQLLKQLAEQPQQSDWASELVRWLLPGPTAQMSLGQMTELVAMLIMSWLGARAKVKPLVIIAMLFGVTRFALYAAAGHYGLISLMWLGVALHGPTYTFFSITGQMFVDRRVSEDMRGQAQALLGLMSTSVGHTTGALSCGLLYQWSNAGKTIIGWTLFWGILSISIVLCFAYFVVGYKQRDAQAS
ncbi:MFS transporter [Rubritalea tangerina]|uniref:MFS transporter n=1 Tax=Rubritalea tangerina TaxID=430798 RepID=UPI003611A0DD